LPEEDKLHNDKPAQAEAEPAMGIEELKHVLIEEKEKSEKYLANWQRVQADFANYKRRVEQGKMEIVEFANSTLILSLLSIMDDFERAFDSLPPQFAESNWIEGTKLIYNKLENILKEQGLTEIKAKGELFDAHLHEAVMSQEGKEGIVIEEIQKGYKLKNRIIRPGKVVVGKSKEKEKNQPESQKGE